MSLQYHLQQYIETLDAQASDEGFDDGFRGVSPKFPDYSHYMRGYEYGKLESEKQDEELEQYLISIGELSSEDI